MPSSHNQGIARFHDSRGRTVFLLYQNAFSSLVEIVF